MQKDLHKLKENMAIPEKGLEDRVINNMQNADLEDFVA
jgi:hypothetical protein